MDYRHVSFGGRSAPPRIRQGQSTGVVQGISMPRQGCGNPGRAVHALGVWAALWSTRWAGTKQFGLLENIFFE